MGSVGIDEIRLWIKLNPEFARFLKHFDSEDSLRRKKYILTPFKFAPNFSFFDSETLDTRLIGNKLTKSLTMGRSAKRSESVPKLVAWKLSGYAKSTDKLHVSKARSLLKKSNYINLVNMNNSADSNDDNEEVDDFEQDAILQNFMHKGHEKAYKTEIGKFLHGTFYIWTDSY